MNTHTTDKALETLIYQAAPEALDASQPARILIEWPSAQRCKRFLTNVFLFEQKTSA